MISVGLCRVKTIIAIEISRVKSLHVTIHYPTLQILHSLSTKLRRAVIWRKVVIRSLFEKITSNYRPVNFHILNTQ
jgi:hypothetical protein